VQATCNLLQSRTGYGNCTRIPNSTLVKVRNVMVAIFKHAQRYGFLPRTQEANPMLFVQQTSVSDYEPFVLTLSQCVDILANLNGMHRVLVLADAATGLRISEILALHWSDIDWSNSGIRVNRAYVYGKFGPPKSSASKKPVPLHHCWQIRCKRGAKRRRTKRTMTLFFRASG